MLSRLARGTFLVVLGLMIVAWAVNMANSSTSKPQEEPPVYGRMYS